MLNSSRTAPMENNIPVKTQLKCEEQCHTDSGFLSSGNLQISSDLYDYELNVNTPVTPMKSDSGVDLGLSEKLSQLMSCKVQVEPTVELTPVNINKFDQHDASTLSREWHQSTKKQINNEFQQLYYDENDNDDIQLHMAIVQDFVEDTFSLIRNSTRPHSYLLNILNHNGQSPLHLAVLARQPRIIRGLILAGANPALRNFRGNTALHLACATGDLASAKALTDPLTSIERNYLLPGKKIPALPQDLEQPNYEGQMCLHIAASSDHVELVRLLVRRGADLDAREGLAGQTALHLAIERNCRSVIAFLLQECRPCLDTPNYAGKTAYQTALLYDNKLARELVRLGATPEPLSESDSDTTDEDESSANNLS